MDVLQKSSSINLELQIIRVRNIIYFGLIDIQNLLFRDFES